MLLVLVNDLERSERQEKIIMDPITDQQAKNPKAVEDFQGGKQAAVGPLIGQVMREVKGADPQAVRQMLIEKLSGA